MSSNSSPRNPSTNTSPMRWGSPALATTTSFPPYRMPAGVCTPPRHPQPQGQSFPHRMTRSRSFGGPARSPPPQYVPNRQMQPSFLTPQPRGHRGPSLHRPPWTEQGERKFKRRFFNNPNQMANPDNNPECNPGGSNDIAQYYNPTMVQDPWQRTPPQPLNYWLNQT